MKTLKFSILLLVSILLLSSCNKEDKYSKQDAQPELDIKCINGILHFATPDVCFTLMDSLSKNNEFRISFEKEHNFRSLATDVDEKINIVSSIENENILKSVIADFKDYIYVTEDNRIFPVVTGRRYALVSDLNGVFYVGNNKHRVVGDVVYIDVPDNDTKATNTQKYSYVASNESEILTKDLREKQLIDIQYEADKRRVYARVHLLNYYVYNSAQNSFISEYVLQFHCSGQKKSLFGWNSYATEFTLERLSYRLQFGWNSSFITDIFSEGGVSQSTSLGPFNSPELRDFYFDRKVIRYVGSGQKWPALQKADFRFRARSRGTGDCGASICDAPYVSYVEMPFVNCK